jgi:hypothetical protein
MTHQPVTSGHIAPDAEPSEPEAEPAGLVAGGPGELVAEPTEPTPGQVILCAPPVPAERKVEIKAA